MIKVIVNDVSLDLKSDAVIALTRKVADIGTLQSRFSSFTNKFQVKGTKKNRDALGIKQYQDTSDSISAGIATPYQELTGKLISNGIEIATNVAVIIESVAEDITLTIRAGNGSLFDKLNRTKLSDIDFSDVNHFWRKDYIEPSLSHNYTNTYIYPICDTGNQSFFRNMVQIKGLIPFLFVKNIFQRIGSLFNYSWTGNTYTSDFFERLLISISSLKVSKSFVDLQLSSVTAISGTYSQNGPIVYFNWNPANNIIFENWLFQTFYCNFPGRYVTKATYDITVTSRVAVANHQLRIEAFKSTTSPNNPLSPPQIDFVFAAVAPSSIDTPVNYNGVINFEYTLDNIYDQGDPSSLIGPTAGINVYFHQDISTNPNIYADVTVNSLTFEILEIVADKTHFNRPLSLGDHLPDWTLAKFIKEVGNIFGAVYDVDEFRKEIEITRLDEIATNRDEAIDWSDKLDLSNSHEVTYIVDGIGRTTSWQWKDDKLYAKSVNVINDQLPENENYVKSDAIYTIGRNILGANFSNTPIPLMSFEVWDQDQRRIQMDNENRFGILLDNPGVVRLDSSNNTQRTPYPAAYFDYDNSPYSLDWSRLYSEYYQGLFEPMTWYMNKVVADFKLNDLDIQSFKFKYPVYIKHFNRYFYVNEISEYTGKDQSTKCTLIAI
jgi:hypothetical protein